MTAGKQFAKLTDSQVVARCPLFAELPAADVTALADSGTRRRYSAGQGLFLAGDRPEGLHIVTRGRVRIYVLSPRNGREITLALEHPFMTVAELPSFDGGPYPANAEALEDCETLLLVQAELERVLAQRSGVALHLLRTVGGRLRRLVGLVEQLSFQGVLQRLALHLLEQSGRVPFRLGTNAEIAAEVGTVPELISRNLARLHQSGAVTLAQRQIVKLDEGLLRDLLED